MLISRISFKGITVYVKNFILRKKRCFLNWLNRLSHIGHLTAFVPDSVSTTKAVGGFNPVHNAVVISVLFWILFNELVAASELNLRFLRFSPLWCFVRLCFWFLTFFVARCRNQLISR